MTTNSNSTEYKMLIWSFDYIKHHRGITTEELPDILIKFWSIPDFTINPQYKEDDIQLIVFMYILRLHKCSEKKVDDIISSFQFKQLFYNFQVILATTALCREAKIKVEPFPIFNIEKYLLPELSNPRGLLEMYRLITIPHINKDKVAEFTYKVARWKKLRKSRQPIFSQIKRLFFIFKISSKKEIPENK